MRNKFPILPAVTLLLAVSLASTAGAQDHATSADEQSAVAAASDQPPAMPDVAEPAAAESQAMPVMVEPANAAIAATAPLSQSVRDAVGTPAEGKALVVFFRPSKFVGAAVGFKVRENEVELGKLRNGNYFTVQVEPGAHAYVVHSEAKDVTNLEVEAGETYFLSAAVTMGFMAGRPNLTPSDAAGFEAALPKLKKSKPLE